jgi:hypothetical protein
MTTPPEKNPEVDSWEKKFDKQYTHGGEWWKEGMIITPPMIKSFIRTIITPLIQDRDARVREERERIEKEFSEYLDKLDAEKGVCECVDKKHEHAMGIYDVAKKHLIIRLKTGIKMASSCDGKNPNLSEVLTPPLSDDKKSV